MNRCYALIWNAAQERWNVAPEGARRRGKSGGGRLAAAVVLLGLGGGLSPAFALPTGGNIVSGSGDIQANLPAGQMSINQHSDKLIVNWNDFSSDPGQRITFNQPTSGSIALNRVIGTKVSEINGKIDANGRVFLVNPNGVLFGKSAQVNVGGLVASTKDLSDKQFIAGDYRFSGQGDRTVMNRGTITAADGGSIALLGAQVHNDGVIQAKMGRVALAAGDTFTVNFDGSNLLNLEVTGATANALARNGGLLKADGGQVLMTARASDAMLRTVVNNQGVIEANSLRWNAGTITLDGGTEGKTLVGGRLTATALAVPGNAGVVDVKGANVEVNLATQVDTRANNGVNGTWKVSASNVSISKTAATTGGTIHTDTVTRNLATTNIELKSTAGDVSLDGPVAWTSGNRLALSSAADLDVNGPITATGLKAGLTLGAANEVRINDKVTISGAASSLAIDSGAGHTVGEKGSVTLTGAGVSFSSNGDFYNVIQNAAQLQAIDSNLHGLYVLGNSINYARLQAIGGPAGVFTGTFDGLGNALNGATVAGQGANVGLFAASAGSISNLKLTNMNIYDNGYRAPPGAIGALVGVNSGTIRNVSTNRVNVTASSSQPNVIGGLVGRNLGRVDGSSSHGTVRGSNSSVSVGGLVGENVSGSADISHSVSRADVYGGMGGNEPGGVGGLVGSNRGGMIADARSEGSTSTSAANVNIGGLVGYNADGDITRASSSGRVQGRNANLVGGLVGLNVNGTVSESESSSIVSGYGSAAIGGLVGSNRGGGSLTEVKATGSVSDYSAASIGGLVGSNSFSRVDTGEATGHVIGGAKSHVGGLIGSNLYEGSVMHGVAGGNVTGGNDSVAGGLVGFNAGSVSGGRASGAVTGAHGSSAGGLVGNNYGSVMASESTGNVRGGSRSRVGGLAGENHGQIAHVSAAGQVSGDSYASLGGLVGLNMGTLSNSTANGKIAYLPNVYYAQTYGGLVGTNYGAMNGNIAMGEAALVQAVGANYGAVR
ncbi:adhesive protein CupB5 [Cupriavidus basilensis OR16]|uniref:Adhesive protein CupB5 n=1 Tax=Cupriavidus basilensis OR16 TaxID=1127483 RepID=H1S7J2_9BURK|nr:GLUG motif-containing protein [Cupriavidus basilensis]EHP41406.1 adhesive protein CupB5 [Cupriavidus basilensis OR16]